MKHLSGNQPRSRSTNHAVSRRELLARFAALPAVALPAVAIVRAQDLPRLDNGDPAAKALLYVEDAAHVDRTSPLAARYEPGQTCANCAQIKGDQGADWRPCGIFPGKLVAAAGWCSVWAPQP